MGYRGVFIALILVVSGCSGISDTATTSTPVERQTPNTSTALPSHTDQLEIQTGEFRFNGSNTVERMIEMLATRVPYVTVSIVPQSPPAVKSCSQSNFYRAIHVRCNVSTYLRPIGGVVHRRSSSVTLWVSDSASSRDVESVFAHELTHVAQQHRGIRYDTLGFANTTDKALVHRLLIEGQAEYVETEYEQRYLPPTDDDAQQKYHSLIGLHAAGTYYFGRTYFESTVDSPSSSWTVFDDPPTTTEMILHPDAARTKPLPLVVTTDSNVQIQSRDTLGELAIRNALRSRLTESQAKAAATGWGNDVVLRVTTADGAHGFVWVTRWDTTSDARSFFEAISDYTTTVESLNHRSSISRPSETTVAMTIGVTNVTVVPSEKETFKLESGSSDYHNEITESVELVPVR